MRGTISKRSGPMMVADKADRDRLLISTDGEVWKSVRTRWAREVLHRGRPGDQFA